MGIDRNQQARMLARMEAQAQTQRLGLIRALREGVAAPVDRFDTKMKVGDLVVWRCPVDHVYQITDITVPPLGSAPPGVLQVVLQVIVPAHVPANTPNQGFIVVGHMDQSNQHGSLGVEEIKKEADREAPKGPVLVDTGGQPLSPIEDLPDGEIDEGGGDGGDGSGGGSNHGGDDDGGGTLQ